MNMKPLPSRRLRLAAALLPVLLAVLLGSRLLLQSGTDPAPVVPPTPEASGRQLAEQQGCLACHSLDGKAGIGPSWRGSYGSVRTFRDGSTAVVDDAYLVRAMRQPQVEVVAGFENLMLPAALSDEQLADVMALIRSLAGAGGS